MMWSRTSLVCVTVKGEKTGWSLRHRLSALPPKADIARNPSAKSLAMATHRIIPVFKFAPDFFVFALVRNTFRCGSREFLTPVSSPGALSPRCQPCFFI